MNKPEQDKELKSNPFALGADTRYRFGLLVAAVVGTTPFLAAPYGIMIISAIRRTKTDENNVDSCIWTVLHGAPDATKKAKDAIERFSVAVRLVREACKQSSPIDSRIYGIYTVAVIALVFAIAVAIYWWMPGWRVRRRRLISLPPADIFPDVHAQLQDLIHITGVQNVEFLLDPLDRRVTGLAFGRVGRRQIVLSRGIVDCATNDQSLFRAIMLHELAHVRNGDIEPTFLTIAVWRAWVALVLVPVTVLTILQGPILAIGWRLITISLLLRIIRDATLRSRERYADARAAEWGAADTLHRALGERASAHRLARLWGTHPDAASRQSALIDPARVIAVGFGDGLALGFTTVIAESAINLELRRYFLHPPPRWIHIIPYAALLSCALAFAIFRILLAANITGRRTAVDLFGAGLGAGLALGVFTAPPAGIWPSDDSPPEMSSTPVYQWILWAGLIVAGGWLSVRWITDLMAMWLPHAARRASPAPTVLGCAAVITFLLTAWLNLALQIPGYAHITARVVYPDFPEILVFLGALIDYPVVAIPLWLILCFITLVWAAPFAATIKSTRRGQPRPWVALNPLPVDMEITAPPISLMRGIKIAFITVGCVFSGALVIYIPSCALIRTQSLTSEHVEFLKMFMVLFPIASSVLAQIIATLVAFAKANSLRLSHAMLAATIVGPPATICAYIALAIASCITGRCIDLINSGWWLTIFSYRLGLVLSLATALIAAFFLLVPSITNTGSNQQRLTADDECLQLRNPLAIDAIRK